MMHGIYGYSTWATAFWKISDEVRWVENSLARQIKSSVIFTRVASNRNWMLHRTSPNSVGIFRWRNRLVVPFHNLCRHSNATPSVDHRTMWRAMRFAVTTLRFCWQINRVGQSINWILNLKSIQTLRQHQPNIRHHVNHGPDEIPLRLNPNSDPSHLHRRFLSPIECLSNRFISAIDHGLHHHRIHPTLTFQMLERKATLRSCRAYFCDFYWFLG